MNRSFKEKFVKLQLAYMLVYREILFQFVIAYAKNNELKKFYQKNGAGQNQNFSDISHRCIRNNFGQQHRDEDIDKSPQHIPAA
ncbi:MAG: hypothetical protein PUA83_00865 [Clostridiales bacterium]|nr:hypothetical protein [Clostridiales bacterium]